MSASGATAVASVEQHFANRAPVVRAVYDRILAIAGRLGPLRVSPKKTSIHLERRSAFAGVATRKDALILTLKAAGDIRSPRIIKREHASAHRWYIEVRLDTPASVDREVAEWIKAAYELAR